MLITITLIPASINGAKTSACFGLLSLMFTIASVENRTILITPEMMPIVVMFFLNIS